MSYKRILLIEDDETDQLIFSAVLQLVEPTVTFMVADDAMEALFRLTNREITADIIFLDVVLPGMTGMEFLSELKKEEQLRWIPVVVMSGVPNVDDMRVTKDLGGLDYFIKPDRYSELRTKLTSILQPGINVL